MVEIVTDMEPKEILQENEIVVLDLFVDWCGPAEREMKGRRRNKT